MWRRILRADGQPNLFRIRAADPLFLFASRAQGSFETDAAASAVLGGEATRDSLQRQHIPHHSFLTLRLAHSAAPLLHRLRHQQINRSSQIVFAGRMRQFRIPNYARRIDQIDLRPRSHGP